ncbi:MAG: hypothetical protein WKG07_13450 [Hymenobacter sp.]
MTAKVSSAGDFRLALPPLPGPMEARLSYDGEAATLYLAPGDALRLSFDPGRLDQTLSFGGPEPAANANNYLAQSYRQANQDDEGRRTPGARAATLSAAELRRAADAYHQRRRSALAAYAAAHPLPAGFCVSSSGPWPTSGPPRCWSYYAHQSTERRQRGLRYPAGGLLRFRARAATRHPGLGSHHQCVAKSAADLWLHPTQRP